MMRVSCQPMFADTPRDSGRRGQRADAGERHLPERELTAPTGEHDDRHRADREREDHRRTSGGGPTGPTSSGTMSATSSANPATSCGMRRTHQISRSRSGTGGDPRREREALAAGLSSRAADARDEHEHDDEEQELHEPGLGREVEEEDLVEDADDDRPERGARERHHAADERGGQAEQQRVRADGDELGRALLASRRGCTATVGEEARRSSRSRSTRASG